MELIKLTEVDDRAEFWRGTTFRLMNNGVDMHPDDKFLDYLLATVPWENDFMILVNITEGSHKRGAVYAAKIQIDKSLKKVVATKGALLQAFGRDFDHCFVVKE